MASVTLGPAVLDLAGIRAGDRNALSLTVTNAGNAVDLTGYDITAQARKTPLATESIDAVIEPGDLTAGQFLLRWPGDAVRVMLGTATTWSGVWDLQIQSGTADPVTIIAGAFDAVMDVTRVP